jgi:predicted  nucleic acid-binding Zn-ribbon protein
MSTEISVEDRRDNKRWWDWNAELDDGREAELQALRATADELRTKVGALERELSKASKREHELREALIGLAGKRGRKRRRHVASLRARKLL